MSLPARATAFGLLVLLLLVAWTRFVGITHHLERGAPDFDERHNFVDPVLRMWRKPTADPTVYAGYPGLFNWLVFVPVGIGHRAAGHVGAYASARAVVAAFSVLNVVLLYLLAARTLGRPYGLFAAALLAASRVDVRSAQHITPDTLVATAALASLLVLSRRPPRAELWLGAIAGAATAVKYTGVLAAVPGLAGLLFGDRRAARGAGLVAAAVLTFALLAPYALLQAMEPSSEQGMGLAKGLETYYGGDLEENRFARGEGTAAGSVLSLLWMTLGPAACLLAPLSLLSRRAPREVAWPAAALVAASVVVMIPANLVYPRHVLPASAVAAFLAASGLKVLLDRPPAGALRLVAGLAIGLPALALPARMAWPVVVGALRVPAVDRAADWIEARLPAPARIATSLRRFQLDEERYEVRYADSLLDLTKEALAHFDAAVAANRREAEALAAFETLARFESEDGDPQRPVTVLRGPRPRLRPAPEVVAVGASAPGHAEEAWSGRGAWRAGPGEGWIEARWAAPIVPARVEVEVPSGAPWPQPLQLLASRDGASWGRLHAETLRPTRPHRQLRGAAHGQVFIPYEERSIVGLRILRPSGGEWSVSGVKVFVK